MCVSSIIIMPIFEVFVFNFITVIIFVLLFLYSVVFCFFRFCPSIVWIIMVVEVIIIIVGWFFFFRNIELGILRVKWTEAIQNLLDNRFSFIFNRCMLNMYNECQSLELLKIVPISFHLAHFITHVLSSLHEIIIQIFHTYSIIMFRFTAIACSRKSCIHYIRRISNNH